MKRAWQKAINSAARKAAASARGGKKPGRKMVLGRFRKTLAATAAKAPVVPLLA